MWPVSPEFCYVWLLIRQWLQIIWRMIPEIESHMPGSLGRIVRRAVGGDFVKPTSRKIKQVTCRSQCHIFSIEFQECRNKPLLPFKKWRRSSCMCFLRKMIKACNTERWAVDTQLESQWSCSPASKVHSMADLVPGNFGNSFARLCGFADRSMRLKLGGSFLEGSDSDASGFDASESSNITSSKSSRPSQMLLPLEQEQFRSHCQSSAVSEWCVPKIW